MIQKWLGPGVQWLPGRKAHHPSHNSEQNTSKTIYTRNSTWRHPSKCTWWPPTIHNDPSQVEKKLEEENSVIVNFIVQFEDYTICTRCGDHQRTTQYMIMYMDGVWYYIMFRYYLMLEGASRTNDVELYTCALKMLTPACLLGNQPSQL